ncbi:hypothetical protein [Microbacterium sp. OR16]|uniref:hypothetical protein n=1 Tax=Microbacterium sp. OR16 TaxID=3095345 RepID=UPI0039B37033
MSAVVGDFPGAIGAVLGGSVASALGEMTDRVLSQREAARVGAVLIMARDEVLAHIANGRAVRGDALMRERVQGRAPIDEVIEHVLRVAQKTYEERKLPYVAAALANIATDSSIDERTAHRLLSELERASWPKLVALAAVRSREASPLPDIEAGEHPPQWSMWSAHEVFTELYYVDQLLGASQRLDAEGLPEVGGARFSDFGLTTAGSLLVDGAGLERIPNADRVELLTAIAVSASDAAGPTAD